MSLQKVADAKFLLDHGREITGVYLKQQRGTPDDCSKSDCRCQARPSDEQKDAD